MKIVDCFMYFDEDLVLEIRLNTLDSIVDKFVICEGTRDHSGKEKKLNFNINKFLKFKDKIKYLVIDDIPVNVGSIKKNWHQNHVRDQFQRNALSRGYQENSPEDWIMISDIDEIPDPKKIKEFDVRKKYACFMQKNFQSKINLLNTSDGYWAGTKICEKKNLKSPQWLRDIKIKKRPFWRIFSNKQPQLIEKSGWHFSFLKDPKMIQKKINSYAHQEFNTEDFKDIEKIKKRIEDRTDLFNRNINYNIVQLDNSFPDYILKNKQKFKEWII